MNRQDEKNINFAREFACKTLTNYYKIKKEKPEISKTAKEKIDKKINKLNEIMDQSRYYRENFYEITQLINSLVGLLIFPQQVAYDKTRKIDYNEFQEEMPVLFSYVKVQDPNKYINTYSDANNQQYLASNTLRHLRNSVAHDKISIRPIGGSIDTDNKKNTITDIIFTDDYIDREFKIIISVREGKDGNDLEKILTEICNVLIAL